MGPSEVTDKYLACGGTAEIATLVLEATLDRRFVTRQLLPLEPSN